jgi:hypothetical protein
MQPATRRLPYDDFGIVIVQVITHGAGQQTVSTASYGANKLGFGVGEFVHVNLGQADEEYVQVLAADPENQTFNAVFAKDHSIGATVRPTIWPTPVLNEGDSLALDILGVANPNLGSDLTVVIQTESDIIPRPLMNSFKRLKRPRVGRLSSENHLRCHV